MSRRKTPPNDPEARNRTKRKTNWTGYAVHLAETCDADGPEIFTHVDTTPATTADVEITDTIHQALAMTGRVTMFGISRWTGASSQFARGERKVAVPTVVQGETGRVFACSTARPDPAGLDQVGLTIRSSGLQWGLRSSRRREVLVFY